MNGPVSLVLVVISTCGGLAGIVGLLQFFNTRKQVKRKSEADIASVWNDLTEGALKSAYQRISDLEEHDRMHKRKENGLIDLVQELIRELPVANREPYQDRLDELRQL